MQALARRKNSRFRPPRLFESALSAVPPIRIATARERLRPSRAALPALQPGRRGGERHRQDEQRPRRCQFWISDFGLKRRRFDEFISILLERGFQISACLPI
jgi:hypothetical protein